MKKLIYLAVAIIMLSTVGASCINSNNQNEKNVEDSIRRVLGDSLATANAEKDSLMALMTEIQDGINQIKSIENIVNQGNLGAETPDKRNALRNDIELIKQSVEQRKQRLDQLEEKLSRSTSYSDNMRKTIEGLKAQLEEQQANIASLTEQLEAAHAEIKTLNERVDTLKRENAAEAEAKRRAQEESERLTNEINTCFYVVGSSNELKQNNIIEKKFLRKTKIMEKDFEKSYFTKADKRTLNEIPLHNKKAQVMSKHPAGSYELTTDANGLKTLRIIDRDRFWELSNYLVVKVG